MYNVMYILVQGSWESARTVATGEYEEMKCDMVSECIGLIYVINIITLCVCVCV